jgi:hypothetical protein
LGGLFVCKYRHPLVAVFCFQRLGIYSRQVFGNKGVRYQSIVLGAKKLGSPGLKPVLPLKIKIEINVPTSVKTGQTWSTSGDFVSISSVANLMGWMSHAERDFIR